MRILVLEPAARHQRARRDQRLDDRLVGVALLALVVEHALALEAGRVLGEGAVFVDGVRDARIDAARAQELLRLGRSPQVEVLTTVARRGMDEACPSVVGDVVAGEEGNCEIVAGDLTRERMGASANERRVRIDPYAQNV